MKAIIYLKDSAEKPSVTIENLKSIKAMTVDSSGRTRDRNYNESNFHVFTPFGNESYAFGDSQRVISICGAEILYVEFISD